MATFEHEPFDYIAGTMYCARCLTRLDAAHNGLDCPIPPCEAIPFGGVTKPDEAPDPIGEAVKESAFDRMDRLFRNK